MKSHVDNFNIPMCAYDLAQVADLIEDFHGAFQKLLEWYNKCIAAGGDYFERD